MDVLTLLKEIWFYLTHLPAEVFGSAFLVFLIVGVFKLVKVAPGGAWSRATNLLVSLLATGGLDLSRLVEFKELLETSAVIVLAVVYYRVWLFAKPHLARLAEGIRAKLDEKKAGAPVG